MRCYGVPAVTRGFHRLLSLWDNLLLLMTWERASLIAGLIGQVDLIACFCAQPKHMNQNPPFPAGLFVHDVDTLNHGFTRKVAMISLKRSWLIAPGSPEPTVAMYPPIR